MRIIAAFLSGLWQLSKNSWVSIFPDLRPRSGASALALFLFLLFFIIGGILMLLGFELDDVDRWLDAQGGWLDALGSILFRLICGAFLLAGVAVTGIGLWGKLFGGRPRRSKSKKVEDDGEFGWGAILVFAVIAYFAWFGVVG